MIYTTFNNAAWSETCLIEVTPIGGTAIQYAAMIETVDIDLGDKDIEQVVTLKGGRLVKKVPQDITSITFEGYPIGIAATSPGKGISQAFHTTSGSYSSSEPLSIQSSLGRDQFRVAILWTDDTTATTASGATATAVGTNAYRFAVANAKLVSMKPSFTDGILKFTFVFKVPAFNKQGTAQIREESTETAATTGNLTALNTYNTTNYPTDGTQFTW